MMMQRTAFRATPIRTPFGVPAVTGSFCPLAGLAG